MIQSQPISAHEAHCRVRESRRKDSIALKEAMCFTTDIQRDYQKWCGYPLAFTAVNSYGRGASPLTSPGNANLKSWHQSNLGLVLAPTLIKSNVTGPNMNWDADVNVSVPFRCDILTTGSRGVATYGLTIDAGLSYFQTGVTAFNVFVPLFGRTLVMDPGTFTTGDTYIAVCKSMANQTPLLRTLNGAATDSSKPLIVPNAQNGFPCLTSVGGTSGGMLDTTSSWASEVAPGNQTWFLVAAPDSAAPSAIRSFACFGCNLPATNPALYFSSRNGTNNYRTGKINDAGTASNQDAGALNTNFHVYSLVRSGSNVSVWVDGVNIVNNLSWGTGTVTCDAAALFCLYRASAQTNNNSHRFLAWTTYDAALSTADRQANEGYWKGLYATP